MRVNFFEAGGFNFFIDEDNFVPSETSATSVSNVWIWRLLKTISTHLGDTYG